MTGAHRSVQQRALAKAKRNARIGELYRSGHAMRDIALQFDLSPIGVLKVLQKISEPRRPQGLPPRNKDRDAEIVRLFQTGLTLAEIGDRFGITNVRVHRIIASAGLNRTHGGSWVRRRGEAASFPLTSAG